MARHGRNRTWEVLVARTALLSLAVTVVGAASCGGGAGGSCLKVQPCGGDIVGNWSVVTECVDPAAAKVDPTFMSFCPTATVDAGNARLSGTYSFKADLTYSNVLTDSGDLIFNLPVSCLNGMDCATFSAGLQAQMAQNPDPSIASVSCMGTSTCACKFVFSGNPVPETGTYVTSGNTVTETSSSGMMTARDYCVQGSTMHIMEVAMSVNMGTMGQVSVLDDTVAQRQ